MKNIGSAMAIFGILAIVLGFLNRVPKLLIWIYNWGETTAWIIKIALVVVGGALYLFSNGEEEEEEQEVSEQ
ncbi:hypothetical protein [Tenacibaculum jejuense]|uniref:Uncharacterized protein n=1 Tax=Tenacibaculum jejuense TaxID=584609 RepID=A0A238U7X6_9FLAO|nr:hypothetical protein [Tenacibaculum jejuense]SNR15192.1 conserved protein of unknown function [Tenacibaculum jejuense]